MHCIEPVEMRKILILCLLFLSINIFSNNLGVPGFPKNDLSIGPSFALVNNFSDDKSGESYDFDIAYTYGILTASSNFKIMTIGDDFNYGAQLELSIWFIFNIGGGVGYLFGDNKNTVKHFFVGLPIPVAHSSIIRFIRDFGFGLFVIEPYYRFNYFNDDNIHEFGLMFKVSTWKG